MQTSKSPDFDLSNDKQTSVDPGIGRLFQGVLERAIEDLRLSSQRGDALRWFNSDFDEYPFAFLRICDYFSVNPDFVRARVRAFLLLSSKEQCRIIKTNLV